MENNPDFIPEIDLLVCPFLDQCILPKNQSICKKPECKLCPDYRSKLNK